MASKTHHHVRLHAFKGMINRAKEILIPLYIFEDREGHDPEECVWVPITKQAARSIVDEAEEREIEEVCGVTEEDGCLYLDGPGDDEDDEDGEEEEEEEVEDEKEGSIETTGETVD
jgi:hypothetical protein